jgi:outer membrane lipoprotein-sorting protein
MRWINLATVLLLAAPGAAQENEAEKLFRAMEKKIRAARSLEIVFEADATDPTPGAANFKGQALFGEGNRFRIEVKVSYEGKKTGGMIASDGKTLYQKDDEAPAKTQPAHAEDAERLRAFVGRGGILAGLGSFADLATTEPKKDFDLEKTWALTDFKLGAKDKIGAREAQIVECTLTIVMKGRKTDTAKMAVWIDTQTQLPLKRRLEAKWGKETTTTYLETYSTFNPDAKIDAKMFELPK